MMNAKYRAGRIRQRAGTLAMLAAAGALTAACGLAHASVHTDLTGSAGYRADLAYARCMRTHGAPDFPLPHPGESFHISGHPAGAVHGAQAKANAACGYLLPPGSVTAN